eukprot:8645602-Ditylum_brightwellii.AAC.1
MDVQAEQKEGEANKDYDSDDGGILEFAMDHNRQDQDGDVASDEESIIEEEEEEKYSKLKEGLPREGYGINFTPDGHTAAKSHQQEYETCSSMGKIESMILHVNSIIDTLCDKQNVWQQNGKTRIRGTNTDTPMDKFCLVMDNYFDLPKVIASLYEMNIGVVGTSHFREAWPPRDLQKYHAARGKLS